MERARLNRYGVLCVSGTDAREFLHAQLTIDIQNLPSQRVAVKSGFLLDGQTGDELRFHRDLVTDLSAEHA